MGLVAGGVHQTMTYTGWRLKDSVAAINTTSCQVLPIRWVIYKLHPTSCRNLLKVHRRQVFLPARLRNILDDPFVVRANREQLARDSITFDPHRRPIIMNGITFADAKFAMNAGFVYRHLPTSQDASIAVSQQRTFFPFSGAAPAQDLWEAYSRIVSKINPDLGLIANLYGGTAQANGDRSAQSNAWEVMCDWCTNR